MNFDVVINQESRQLLLPTTSPNLIRRDKQEAFTTSKDSVVLPGKEKAEREGLGLRRKREQTKFYDPTNAGGRCGLSDSPITNEIPVYQLSIDEAFEKGSPTHSAAIEDSETIEIFVVAPHIFLSYYTDLDWIFSTSSVTNPWTSENAMCVSIHQMQHWQQTVPKDPGMYARMLTLCVLERLLLELNLETCENSGCVLNNCDHMAEAERFSFNLLPCITCMRKMYLFGYIKNNDVVGFFDGVKHVLEKHKLLM